jgi:hypothetical protein
LLKGTGFRALFFSWIDPSAFHEPQKVAPVALRLAIGEYFSQRETSYLNPKVAPVALRLAMATWLAKALRHVWR